MPPYFCLDPVVDSEYDDDDDDDDADDDDDLVEDEPKDEIEDFHFGFGYDDSTHTYKLVIAFVNSWQPRRTTIQAYTMGCDWWRKIYGLDNFPRLVGGNGRFVSGIINWLALPEPHDEAVIVSLDLRTDTYKQLSLPDEERNTLLWGELRVMRGSLCFFHDYTKTNFVLWQMKEFGDENSWTRLLKIPIDDGLRSLLPVCISDIDNGDVVMLASYINSEEIFYNGGDNRVECTQIPIRIWHVNDYFPSLVSLL